MCVVFGSVQHACAVDLVRVCIISVVGARVCVTGATVQSTYGQAGGMVKYLLAWHYRYTFVLCQFRTSLCCCAIERTSQYMALD